MDPNNQITNISPIRDQSATNTKFNCKSRNNFFDMDEKSTIIVRDVHDNSNSHSPMAFDQMPIGFLDDFKLHKKTNFNKIGAK